MPFFVSFRSNCLFLPNEENTYGFTQLNGQILTNPQLVIAAGTNAIPLRALALSPIQHFNVCWYICVYLMLFSFKMLFICDFCPHWYGLYGLSMAVISSVGFGTRDTARTYVDIRFSFCLSRTISLYLDLSLTHFPCMRVCVCARQEKLWKRCDCVCMHTSSLTHSLTHPHNVFSRGNAPFQSQQTFTKIIYLSSLYPFKWPKLFRCLHSNYTHTGFACLSTLFAKETRTTICLRHPD